MVNFSFEQPARSFAVSDANPFGLFLKLQPDELTAVDRFSSLRDSMLSPQNIGKHLSGIAELISTLQNRVENNQSVYEEVFSGIKLSLQRTLEIQNNKIETLKLQIAHIERSIKQSKKEENAVMGSLVVIGTAAAVIGAIMSALLTVGAAAGAMAGQQINASSEEYIAKLLSGMKEQLVRDIAREVQIRDGIHELLATEPLSSVRVVDEKDVSSGVH